MERIVFFGTPPFAVESLQALYNSGVVSIAGVVTTPDKPAGRGQRLLPTPVKEWALTHGIPVLQPASLGGMQLSPDGAELLGRDVNRDLSVFLNAEPRVGCFVVVAYGKLIPKALLNYPTRGVVNVHPSLLPRWRGAAPIQRAIFSGDSETGVCLMKMDEGLDTGPVYTCLREAIGPDDTFGTLRERLATLSAKMLCEFLPTILGGALTASPQSSEGLTYAEKWDQEDQQISWDDEPEVTLRRIRTCSPEPGARTAYEDLAVKIYRARAAARPENGKLSAGTIVNVTKSELVVSAGKGGAIAVLEMQLPGKKRLAVGEILKGRSFKPGSKFT